MVFFVLVTATSSVKAVLPVHMADALIQRSNYDQSGFYLDNLTALLTQVRDNEALGIPTVLLGVSFALMDFADLAAPLPLRHTVGHGNRRHEGPLRELTKEALHAYLQQRLHTPAIHSEYGMTELLSQAHSKGNGRFSAPDWMRVYPRELRDPFAPVKVGRSGVLRILDLANVHSCAFIETQDLGRCHADGTFEVLAGGLFGCEGVQFDGGLAGCVNSYKLSFYLPRRFPPVGCRPYASATPLGPPGSEHAKAPILSRETSNPIPI